LKVLLTGCNGQVGWELAAALPVLGEVIATDRSRLDLSDFDTIRSVVRDAMPQVIVNAAAYTAVDKAEVERAISSRINAAAPGVLADEAKRIDALLVHYSTDYVFDGGKRSPYVESDTPGPLSHYAHTKLEGEQAVAASGCRHLILRTSWVYGPRASNFYQIIRRKAHAHEPMLMVDDQTSVPTPSAFVAEHTISLIRKAAVGLFHLVPSGEATRYDFAREVAKAMGSRSTIEAVGSSRFPSAARRPAYSVMSNGTSAKVLGRALPDWRQVLALV
jgi:dTDP-4-dehydrorhamnose reductase